MMSSSLVGMTRTSIFERGVEITASSAPIEAFTASIEFEPAKIKIGADFGAQAGIVFSNASGEDEDVGAVDLDQELADKFANVAGEYVEGDPGVLVAGFGGGEDVADIAGRQGRTCL